MMTLGGLFFSMKNLRLPRHLLVKLGIDLDVSSDDDVYILEQKGKTLHLLLLALVFTFCVIFTIINIQTATGPAAITFIPVPLTVICLLLYIKGYVVASKLLNFIQVSTVIAVLDLIVTPSSGILAYYIPTIVGAQIMFAGKRRRLGHLLSVIVLLVLAALVLTDFRLAPKLTRNLEDAKIEWLMNFGGSTLAVLFEIIFILSVSNRIQTLLINKKHLIEKQNEELQRTNEELDRFVYAVSHDLRTPLVSLKGLLDLILRLPLQPEKAVNYLQMAKTSTNRLDETIRDILEYARNARLEPVPEHFDLLKMAEQVFADHSFAARRPVKLVLKHPDAACKIVHDKTRLHILLRNLIGNAIKYSSQQVDEPFVAISCSHQNGQLCLEITDNGEGISPDCLPKIFDMFFRGTSTAEGTGLGLYICKQIVTKLDGKITVESQPNLGTTVKVTLPMKEIEETGA